MSDDHKVKDAMLDALMPSNQVNQVKKILLQWLILCGRDEVSYEDLMEQGVDDNISMYELEDAGFIKVNTKAPTYRYALTDRAVEYINKGGNNEQQDHNTIKY
jgi:hypothetical protein